MSDPVIVAIISVVFGGIFTAVFKFIDAKANIAKEELNRNTAEVDAVNRALEGMQVLANNLRIDYDREHIRANDEQQRGDRLEKDLIEEKAINVALLKELENRKER